MVTLGVAASMLGLSACYGGLADAASGDDDDTAASAGDSPTGAADTDGAVEPELDGATRVTVRRLTRRELRRTLRDLTGADIDTESILPGEEQVGPFSNNADALTFPQVFAEGMVTIAERAAAHVVAELVSSGACGEGVDDGCAVDVLERFVPRAWRRPVSEPEQARIVAVYERGRDNDGPAHGLELALQSVLVGAPFVYRIEHGEPGDDGGWRPTSPEMAVRLSYLIWGTTPDDELLARGREGALTDPEQIVEQARRMLDDPRAHDALAEFHRQWLGLDALGTVDKDLERFPHWDPRMVQSMATEAQMFLDEVAFGGRMSDLFTGRFTYVDAMLAELYGLDAVDDGSGFVRVELPAEGPRAGLLTQGAFLAMNADFSVTSPVRRGVFVRERLLCEHLPPPPPTVDDTAPEPSTAETTRERYEEHETDPSCRACHVLMDPIGFGFEHFDATGRWREQQNGRPIDATGYVEGTDIRSFDGAVELAAGLAAEPRVIECLARRWAEYAYGRAEGLDPARTLAPLAAVAADTLRYRELVLATVTTPEFLQLDRPAP